MALTFLFNDKQRDLAPPIHLEVSPFYFPPRSSSSDANARACCIERRKRDLYIPLFTSQAHLIIAARLRRQRYPAAAAMIIFIIFSVLCLQGEAGVCGTFLQRSGTPSNDWPGGTTNPIQTCATDRPGKHHIGPRL